MVETTPWQKLDLICLIVLGYSIKPPKKLRVSCFKYLHPRNCFREFASMPSTLFVPYATCLNDVAQLFGGKSTNVLGLVPLSSMKF